VLDAREVSAFEYDIDAVIKDQLERRKETVGGGNVCKFYQKGTCMKGSGCQYRHSRARQEKSTVCKHWWRGLCKKAEECEFLHQLDFAKMPPCHFFVNYGQCSNPDCVFRHIKAEDIMKDCPWYARGFCKHGPNCRGKHVRKAACPDYLAGFCKDGPDCKRGHPKHELPIDDGEVTRPRGPMMCEKCHQTGHTAPYCPLFPSDDGKPKRKMRDVQDVQCFKCGQMGHYANSCTNLRIAPPVGGYQLPSYALKRQRGALSLEDEQFEEEQLHPQDMKDREQGGWTDGVWHSGDSF